jgi:superfamily II DNA/RNA helicase
MNGAEIKAYQEKVRAQLQEAKAVLNGFEAHAKSKLAQSEIDTITRLKAKNQEIDNKVHRDLKAAGAVAVAEKIKSDNSPEPLHVQARKAVELLNTGQHFGSILVFLPGIGEIRRTMRECETIARQTGLLILPLHGDLSPAEQDRAVLPSAERKPILATNVAESSVTVEGVTAVVDSGLARIATYSPWTGLPTLQVGRVSKASATQRAGRAGRTGPGDASLFRRSLFAATGAQHSRDRTRRSLAALTQHPGDEDRASR